MNLLSLINPKAWIVSLLKSVAIKEVQKEGDLLQEKLKAAVLAGGPKAINKVIDESQARLIGIAKTRGPLWAWLAPIRQKIAGLLQEHGDSLQQRLDQEIVAGGPAAIDRVVDAAQAILISRISAL